MVEHQNGSITAGSLPPGLRELCLRMLTGLPGIKSVLIYDHPEETLLDRGSSHTTMRGLMTDEALHARVLEIADLLAWHFSRHWTEKTHEEDEHICVHCGIGSTDNPESFCLNPHCSCHKKWQAIIGPGYNRPRIRT